MNHADESVVVVPSVTSDPNLPNAGSLNQAYEERFLFLLLLLRQPRLRMIYVTSMPISPTVVEYYLALLPGVIPSHARARLSLVSVGDSSPAALSEKLLARPRLLRRIAGMIPNPERSHLVPYNTTELERDLALSLGIPMYGADPRLAELGSKTGCRRLFGEVGVQYPRRSRGRPHPRRHGRGDQRHAPPASGTVQCDREAQRRRVGPGERRRRPVRAPGGGAGRWRAGPATRHADAARVDHHHARVLSGELRRDGWHRRGADRRRGDSQPERPAARHPGRRRRAPVDPRPAPRRRERSELPGVCVPGRPGLREDDRRPGTGGW